MERHFWNSETDVAEFIAALIKMTGANTVLEIGVFEGYTSAEIIKALPNGGYYVGVDIKDYLKAENKKVFTAAKKEGKVADLIIGDSLEELKKFPAKHFGVIFVDGNHEYSHVMQEFKLCEHLIAENGVMLFHDSIHLPDVKAVVDYAQKWGYKVSNLMTSDKRGLAIVHK
jgi:predicted O-methyltransferase YrrM